MTFAGFKIESPIMDLSPEQISPIFVEHIKNHRNSYHELSPSPVTHHARDWCIDGLHTNRLGGKTGLYGIKVAGGGVRRVSHNDDFPLSILPPMNLCKRFQR